MGIRTRLLCVSSVLAGLKHSKMYGYGSLLIIKMELCGEQPQRRCRCVLVVHFPILCLCFPISSMAVVTAQSWHTTLL